MSISTLQGAWSNFDPTLEAVRAAGENSATAIDNAEGALRNVNATVVSLLIKAKYVNVYLNGNISNHSLMIRSDTLSFLSERNCIPTNIKRFMSALFRQSNNMKLIFQIKKKNESKNGKENKSTS